MKTKFSKRIISLFLAVLMVVTSIPMFAISASAGMDNCKYLFAYFTGNSKYGQNVRFAISEDGYTFTALNDNKPVVTQTKGTSDTSSGYARDPYITRDPNGNGFYMVATDMDASGIHSSWSGDSCIYVWHSADLTSWEQIADFDFRTCSGFENTIRAWAPQIIWDSANNRWMVYLSITKDGEWNIMYYCYTTDFQTFTTPEKFTFSTGDAGRIDADIVENNGTYYMYYKDETSATVMLATSDSLTGTYTPQGDISSALSSKAVEGNAMYQIANTNEWVIMLDEYADGTFAYGKTTDFKNFTKYTGSTSANSALKARHGSVMQITDEEYNNLVSYNDWLTTAGTNSVFYSFYDEYTVSDSGWTYWPDDSVTPKDTSTGKIYDVMVSNRSGSNGNFASGNGYAKFDSACVFINDGDARNIVQSDNFSIAFTHVRQSDTVGSQDFKNTGYVFGIATNGTDYLRLTESGKLGVNIGGSIVEAQSSVDIPTGTEQKFVVTYDGETTRLYIDGVFACSVDGVMKARPSVYTGFGYTDQAGDAMGNCIFGSLGFYDTTYASGEILDAMATFEDKVKSVTDTEVYTNMGEAYDSYVNCQKVYDSVYYGGKDGVDIGYYVSQLKYDVSSMRKTANSITTANVTPTWVLSTSNVESGYYSNVLWTPKTDHNTVDASNTDKNVINKFRAIKDFVFLLDGNSVKIPVSQELQKNSKILRDGNFAAMFLRDTTASTFSFSQPWQGYDDTGWEHWPTDCTEQKIGIANDNTYVMSVSNANTPRHFKNYLVYNGSGNTSTYYDTVTSIDYTSRWKDGSTSNYTLSGLNWYFVNYSPLKDALNTKYFNNSAKNYLIARKTDIANYSEGGADDIFNAANCLVDPTSYTFGTNTSDSVQILAFKIKDKVNEINSVSGSLNLTTDSSNYAALREAMDLYETNCNGSYTSESIEEYKKIYQACKKIMADVLEKGYSDKDSYAGVNAEALSNVLNEELNLTNLLSTIQSKPIYSFGKQVYSANSWLDNVGASANTYNILSSNGTNNVIGRYGTYADKAQAYNFDGTTFDYTKIDISKDNKTTVDSATSTVQSATLDTIPEESQIAFNTSVQIAEAIEKDKYTNSSELTALVAAQKKTVFAVTQANADLYNSFYTDTQIGDINKVFATNLSDTDTATANILNQFNSLTAKTFNTYLQVVDKDNNVESKSTPLTNNYGDLITVNSGVTDIPVAWTVKLYAEDDTNCTGPVKKTITYAGFSGTDLQIKTESNAVVTAKPAFDEAPASGIVVRVYNGYNNLIDVVYANSLDDAKTEINKIKTSMPFYAFNSWDWDNCKEVKTGIYKVTPKFDSATTVNITTIDGGAISVKAVNINSAATVHTDTEHYGWAVKTESGKYQIVAYTDGDYKFSALVNETYVPIIENGGSYYVADGATNVQLTATNVDGFDKPDVDTINDQDFLNAKLAQKSPFVYFQAVDSITESPKVKVYMRATAGNYISDADSFAFGIVLNDKKFVVKARNELTGQFYCRLSESSAAYLNTGEAFVTYNYEYSGYGNLATTDTYAFATSSLSA